MPEMCIFKPNKIFLFTERKKDRYTELIQRKNFSGCSCLVWSYLLSFWIHFEEFVFLIHPHCFLSKENKPSTNALGNKKKNVPSSMSLIYSFCVLLYWVVSFCFGF